MRLLSLLFLPTLALAAPKPLFRSPVIDTKTPNHSVDIDVSLDGAKELFLVVTDAGNGFTADWADWAEPRLVLADGSEKKLTEIEWKSAQSGWGGVRVNANAEGKELRSAGKGIEYGLGTHANSVIAFNLPAGTKRFKARGALDEGGTKQGNSSSVTFSVFTENPGPIAASDNNTAAHEPENATQQLDVHPECIVQLFASEPMMLSPASIDIDHRGRVWVCEVVNYRKHNGERAEGDRILILEDTDGDAKADKSTVFHQGADVNSAHGICVLGNKALISCGDDVFWLIDDNGDDKADRKELMFTKIGGAQHDHGIHAFHFGPDGRLYFNFGNAGKQLCDKDGNLITDIHGVKCTNQNNRPYQQGMVFRCELDGSNVELLAWNFRNNWEVAVDSFGTLWQSDNDDDGNKGVRINYVMEFGNYGYSDEMTGEGWQVPRIGWESEIPQRHWHQNDPGVVPNMLLTGAGSPTGMQVYEGDLLPSIFHGQPIHCDAGPNVVRGYITQPDGAGYKAEIVNLLDGSQNRWFRPSDVAVAPDGSLIVADWYDPGVGGHGMGDVTRGRLFRVTTKAGLKFQVPSFKLETAEGAVEALKSPNESARYLAWQALKKLGGREALTKLFEDVKALPHHRARALWALQSNSGLQPANPSKGQNANESASSPADELKLQSTLAAALTDNDPNLRITALRAARQLWQQKQPEKLREVILRALFKDEGDSVVAPASLARETAIALRFDPSEDASGIWVTLWRRAKVEDIFMYEALAIGAALSWKQRIDLLGIPHMTGKGDEKQLHAILARSRLPESAEFISSMLDGSNDQEITALVGTWVSANKLHLLRALQLLQYHHREEVSKAALTIFLKADPEPALAATALLDRNAIASNPEAKTRLEALLKPVIGKADFVALVERLNLTGFEKELLDFISANPNAPESVNAARLIAANRDGALRFLKDADAKSAKALIAALGRVSDRAAVAVMNQHFWPEKREDVRRVLIDALALSGEGGRAILKWQSEGKLPPQFKDQAALALSRSTDAGLRDQAARELPLPAAQGLANFPKLPELLKLKGDAAKGQAMFMQAGCVACHRVKGQFIDFGPDLTQIGAKLSQDGLFTAILYPSAAIEHSFVGQNVTTKEGQAVMGYVVSETDAELTLRMAGGASTTVKKVNIVKKEELKDSLMPPGLAGAIGPQGLADLVAWLQQLK
ncbi:MAG: NPCBM/NEW2 domain-containing protein [Prosthecobacter sp.]|uniref:PVC-type heme-binding CxxCH protein n=1 Tax=Prosthecobacter sp. TaxID=1965333 RepID=UPI0019F04E3B|nr:PVC-type heme-binding CxxCH protein [Prosthecobacter sp.]MBE2284666.1 NPCBM/NEW2 domain-containing protein [Prosthecobacter sp.]